MGVDTHVLRFLLESRRVGVSLESVMMIGRQNYSALNPRQLHEALLRGGSSVTEAHSEKIFHEGGGHIEPLLRLLGARRVESLDASSFERATVIHDLNQPIPNGLKGAFSCVLDGGSLEHVFNFPQAIQNCMSMISPGGHFLGITAGNNFLGHGFYQFSPELFYRVFCEENGFAVEAMILCETDAGAPWYGVVDPQTLGRRVELINTRPTYLMVRARRLRNVDIFRIPPQQSDYVSLWANRPLAARSPSRRRLIPVLRRLPEFVKRTLRPFRALVGLRIVTLGPSSFTTDKDAYHEI